MNLKPSEYFEKLINIQKKLDYKKIEKFSNLVISKIKNNNSIYLIGNGGSAYNASHYVTDWLKFSNYSKTKIFSLSDNTGLLTAYANDISYNEVYIEQLKKTLEQDDLLIALSGSGNSLNLIQAINYSINVNVENFSIVGFDGGELKKISNDFIHIPSFDMQICEDIQLQIGHYVMKKIINID